jgi:hypothetical protein
VADAVDEQMGLAMVPLGHRRAHSGTWVMVGLVLK